MSEKITPKKLREMKRENEKIVVLTAYDYSAAKILEQTNIEAILVGDSVGNTVLGYKNTIPVTMNEMLHHTKAVAKGIDTPLLIGDMPFLSYQASLEEAVKNAGRFIKEGNAEAVKLEGGSETIRQVEKIIKAGIPVMGHLGLTPQKIHQFGGYQPRGKSAKEAKEIFEDAQRLEEAGVFSIVLESIPRKVAEKITENVDVPTIGIGAGPSCDGQVLVFHDVLGMSEFSPSFVKQYADLFSEIKNAVSEFRKEVKSGDFPDSEHSYGMKNSERKKLKGFLEDNS